MNRKAKRRALSKSILELMSPVLVWELGGQKVAQLMRDDDAQKLRRGHSATDRGCPHAVNKDVGGSRAENGVSQRRGRGRGVRPMAAVSRLTYIRGLRPEYRRRPTRYQSPRR